MVDWMLSSREERHVTAVVSTVLSNSNMHKYTDVMDEAGQKNEENGESAQGPRTEQSA
jgi:hypothetical protein